MPELERAPETTENITSSSQSQNQSGELNSESQSSESRPTLDTFGSPSNGDSSPLFSTSSSDQEFEQVASELSPLEGAVADALDGTKAVEAKLIEFPVLDREDIEAALRVGHSVAVAKGWGEHWKLQDWQSTMLVPPLDAFLQKVQGKAESYLGDFLTRFAGENKELCALLAVAVIVYAPNVRKTMKLKQAQDGAAIAGTTTASAASSVTSGSQA